MNTYISNDIGQLLEDNGYGTQGSDLFIGDIPWDVDNGINILEIAGPEQRKFYRLYEADIEITVRNNSTQTALEKITDIMDFLHLKGNFQATSSYVYFIHALSNREDVGRDENKRKLYKVTFRVIYREDIS